MTDHPHTQVATADPLGPVEETFEADPAVFRRVFLALLAVGLALVGLGFVLSAYSIELWMFGGFAVVMAFVTRSVGGRTVAGTLTLHRDGFRYAEAGAAAAIRWDEIDGVVIHRIPVKMQGLITVDHLAEVTVRARDGRTVRLRRAFLDQIPEMQVKPLVARFEAYERS